MTESKDVLNENRHFEEEKKRETTEGEPRGTHGHVPGKPENDEKKDTGRTPQPRVF